MFDSFGVVSFMCLSFCLCYGVSFLFCLCSAFSFLIICPCAICLYVLFDVWLVPFMCVCVCYVQCIVFDVCVI